MSQAIKLLDINHLYCWAIFRLMLLVQHWCN